MRRRLVWFVAAAAVVAVGIAGVLVWQWPRGERSGPLVLRGDDPQIHVFEARNYLALGGQLGVKLPVSYDPETRCLYVTYPEEKRNLPVWPHGTRPVIEDGRRGVRVPDVGLILEGDRITDAGIAGDTIYSKDLWGDVGQALRDLDTCLSLSNEFTLFYDITSVERLDA